MSFGTAAGTDIPIEHLDYGYIRNCNSSKEVEQILKVLRSGKEGHYPDLVSFTEKRLTELNPNSKLLIKSERAKWLSDLSCEDSNDIANELKQWEEEMGSADSTLKGREDLLKHGDRDGLPPVRRPGNISGMTTTAPAEDKSKKSTVGNSQRIKSSDFRGWDKYNVEKEIEKLESEDKQEEQFKPVTSDSSTFRMDSELTEIEKSMSLDEKQRSATREREKGNEAFRSGDYQEALVYYTRSIKFCSTPAAHNNRAITEIKLENYSEAIADCSQVLSVEPHNTKALFRRATAYFKTKEYRESADDYEQLLKLDPNNKKAQEELNLLRKNFLDPDTKQGGKKKGRKVQIQEVEDEPDAGSGTTNKSAESVPSSVGVVNPPVAPPPLPPHVQTLKDEGNELFRRGQYGEAVNKYTKAINHLEKDDSQVASLSTLLNNRAACHLKNGNSRGCVDDCTRSLSLVPINLKALIRRGQAYEAMEKYKHAYNDFQLALRVDNTVESAFTASARISKLLREQEGTEWRSKLSECPEAASVMAALSEQRQALLVKSSPNDQNSESSVSGKVEASSDNTETSDNVTTKQSTTDTPISDDSGKKSTDSNRIETDGVTASETDTTSHTVPSEPPSTELPSAGDRPDPAAQNQSEPEEAESGVIEGGESGNESDDEGSEEEDDRSKSSGGESESETISEPVQKVPDIKPVDVTTTSTAIKDFSPHVTQSTRPVSSAFMTSQTPPEKRKEIPPEEKFEGYKTKGNEHVKNKEYVDALRYYSLCIEVCPDRAVGYTNRAFCHLKLDSPRNAEEDCNKALSIEPGNIKALYRRGLARKDLKRYADSAKDLKTLLNLDPSNTMASQKLSEVKQLWEKELREIQAKASANRKPRHHSSSSAKKKETEKDKQKKVPPNLAQTEKSLRETKVALENLLKEMKAKTSTAESTPTTTTAASGEGGGAKKTGRAESSSKSKKRTGSRTASTSKSNNNQSTTTPEHSETRTSSKQDSVLTVDKSAMSADMTAMKTTYYEPKKDDESSSNKDTSPTGDDVKKETKQRKRKKIVIEEVDDSLGSEEEVVSPTTSTAASVEKKSKPVETSFVNGGHSKVAGDNLAPYEFVQRWNAIPRTAQSIEYASLLEQIPPEKLPEVITNKLDGMMLTNIIRAIDKQFVPRKLYALSTEILQNLCKVPRFGMNAMFLGPKEKLDLKNVFSALSEQQETPIPSSTLASLKKEYGVDS